LQIIIYLQGKENPMLNKIMLIGNLGKDPDLQVTSDGTPYTRFSLAVNRTYKTQTGEKKEETEWFNIVAWRQRAELCERYLHKGSKVYIEGRVTQRKYTDKQDIERISVDVEVRDVQFLDKKPSGKADEEITTEFDPFLPEN
jgi:single-strand DNA-binding protein